MHRHLSVLSLWLMSCTIALSLTPRSSRPSSLVSPFSLLPPLLLSFHSTGMKRNLEWKKYIRYPSSHHLSIHICLSEAKGSENHDMIKKKKKESPGEVKWMRWHSFLKPVQIWVILGPVQKEHWILSLSYCRYGCIAYIMSPWHSGKFAFVLRAGCHGILFWFCRALCFLSLLRTYLVIF